jgi:Fe-S cluster assembly ATP-binding protein
MKFQVKDLWVQVAGQEVLKGVSLQINPGQIIALMGPNGSGKSSLANALMGHPTYEVTQGKVTLGRKALLTMTPDQRAAQGLFMAFQYPVGISGVSVRQLLLASLRARGLKVSALELKKKIALIAQELGLKEELINRDLNEGFSGGEKKKMEILQLRLLSPRIAILDETDSGLDIDALKTVARNARLAAKKEKMGVLVITHYQRLLNYLKPDEVLVLKSGRIVDQGGQELVKKLEREGYKLYD